MTNVIDRWQTCRQDTPLHIDVLPDGCQDIIVIESAHAPIQMQYTPIYSQAISVEIVANTVMCGFRLQPGCQLLVAGRQKLQQALQVHGKSGAEQLLDIIETYTHTPAQIQEVLMCIATKGESVQRVAQDLGVSERTLQRLVRKHTGYSPLFWLRLARARRVIRQLIDDGYDAEVAYAFNFSDQAHMCREIKQWMGVTPSQLLMRPDLMAQFGVPGYA